MRGPIFLHIWEEKYRQEKKKKKDKDDDDSDEEKEKKDALLCSEGSQGDYRFPTFCGVQPCFCRKSYAFVRLSELRCRCFFWGIQLSLCGPTSFDRWNPPSETCRTSTFGLLPPNANPPKK